MKCQNPEHEHSQLYDSTHVNTKVNVKLNTEQATKDQRGSRGIALLFL
jgi:hypothetical protein